MGSCYLMGTRISVGEDEKYLEMDAGNGCIIMWMHSMSLSYTLKNGLKW